MRFSGGLLCFSHHRRLTQTGRTNALLRHGYEDGWKPHTIEYYENDLIPPKIFKPIGCQLRIT